DEIGDPRILFAGAAALALVGDVGLVGEIHGDGEEIADPRGALVLEEGAAAVPPQRVGVVGRRLRFWHRHLHRLVAGLRRRIFDLGQFRLFTDLRQPVDRRASAGDAEHEEQRTRLEDADTSRGEHVHYSVLAAASGLALATETGAVDGAASEDVVSG